ncbi:MAG: hypothetical protein DMF99_30180 [Acidobacteria bacterium]|nr:MAG: hypothetical protein DMF99_30180 [Acidobacteriota bacterium]
MRRRPSSAATRRRCAKGRRKACEFSARLRRCRPPCSRYRRRSASNQRALLTKLIDVYTGYMAADIAADRVARLKKAGEDKIVFAWAGPVERGKKHYYRVQGPTFLIEYDNTQNDANHIHSVWRDFSGDFGQDLLRDHVKSVAH